MLFFMLHQHSEARVIMVFCLCVCRCVSNVVKYWIHFHQTFGIDAFWDKDECFNFGSQKVKGQGQHEQEPSGWRHTELDAVHRVLIFTRATLC